MSSKITKSLPTFGQKKWALPTFVFKIAFLISTIFTHWPKKVGFWPLFEKKVGRKNREK